MQYVDIEVTKIKFAKEVEEFKELEYEYRKRGVFCTEINDFAITFLFIAPTLKPPPIAFAVVLDYTNWDCEPPSVMLVDPFTGRKLLANEVGIQFLQWNIDTNQPQPLLVGHEIPFFCIPGIREYHNHAHHSGDSWMLYRTRGEGKLLDIIEKLIKHSISILGGYMVNINVGFTSTILAPDLNKIPR